MDQRLIPNPIVDVGAARFGNDLPLALIAGPCQLESREHALEMASALKEIAVRLERMFEPAIEPFDDRSRQELGVA